MISKLIEGVEGQFRKGDVVYNLNDVTEDSQGARSREAESDGEHDQPAKKKAKKNAKAEGKKPDKDQEITLKVKSALKQLESQTPSATEHMDVLDDGDADVNSADSDDNDIDSKWKDNMVQKASEAFYMRRSGKGNLGKMIYGTGMEEADELDGSATSITSFYKIYQFAIQFLQF